MYLYQIEKDYGGETKIFTVFLPTEIITVCKDIF